MNELNGEIARLQIEVDLWKDHFARRSARGETVYRVFDMQPYFGYDVYDLQKAKRFPVIEFIDCDQVIWTTIDDSEIPFHNDGVADWTTDPFYMQKSE